MKAIVHDRYGGPDVLRFEDVERPSPPADRVLIRVRAAAVNPLDWHYMRGTPMIMRATGAGLRAPKNPVRGADLAGIVEAVGSNVTGLQPGDEVYGAGRGTFAEYATALPKLLAPKPKTISFAEAAAVPVAAATALQALRDSGRVQAGGSVLINGAAGGVGTFAVQIAKTMGAIVTGVCSTRNVELVRSLGADHVVDYTRDDFTGAETRYEVMLDLIGNHSLRTCRRVLTPKGTLVISSGGGTERTLLGPVLRIVKAVAMSPFVGPKMTTLDATTTTADLSALAEMIDRGEIKPVIDRTYPLSETADAIRYLEQGHARGKVVIEI